MLLTEMTSRKSSENKSRSYRQCVETIHGKPKLMKLAVQRLNRVATQSIWLR